MDAERIAEVRAAGRPGALPSITRAAECVLIRKVKKLHGCADYEKWCESKGRQRDCKDVHVKGKKEDGKCCNFPVLHAVPGWPEKSAALANR